MEGLTSIARLFGTQIRDRLGAKPGSTTATHERFIELLKGVPPQRILPRTSRHLPGVSLCHEWRPRFRVVEAARDYIAKACEGDGVKVAHLRSGARGAAVSRCRSKAAWDLGEEMALPLAEAPRRLGV